MNQDFVTSVKEQFKEFQNKSNPTGPFIVIKNARHMNHRYDNQKNKTRQSGERNCTPPSSQQKMLVLFSRGNSGSTQDVPSEIEFYTQTSYNREQSTIHYEQIINQFQTDSLYDYQGSHTNEYFYGFNQNINNPSEVSPVLVKGLRTTPLSRYRNDSSHENDKFVLN